MQSLNEQQTHKKKMANVTTQITTVNCSFKTFSFSTEKAFKFSKKMTAN